MALKRFSSSSDHLQSSTCAICVLMHNWTKLRQLQKFQAMWWLTDSVSWIHQSLKAQRMTWRRCCSCIMVLLDSLVPPPDSTTTWQLMMQNRKLHRIVDWSHLFWSLDNITFSIVQHMTCLTALYSACCLDHANICSVQHLKTASLTSSLLQSRWMNNELRKHSIFLTSAATFFETEKLL